MPKTKIPRERIERAARMYSSAKYAAQALGITRVAFCRLCNQYGIAWANKGKQR